MTLKRHIEVSPVVYAQLAAIAVPLVDTVDDVIVRLIKHWNRTKKQRQEVETNFFVTPEGEYLPMGLAMIGSYHSEVFEAVVTDKGIKVAGLPQPFLNLSRAAVAVKKSRGAAGNSAQSNGWLFWRFRDTGTDKLTPMDAWRRHGRAPKM